MTDVRDINEFIDKLGDDISETYVPTVQTFIHSVGQEVAADAAPKVGQFIDELVKDIFAKQSGPIQDFLTKLIQDLASRYHPEVHGNLTAKIVDQGIEIKYDDTKLELKKRATGDPIASLKIPISVKINLADFTVNLQEATVDINS